MIYFLIHILYIIILYLIFSYLKNYYRKPLQNNFFIPEFPTYNELYISILKDKDLSNIKYIEILPNADSFVSKSNLWEILKNTKYSEYVPKTYILENKSDFKNFKNNFKNFKNNYKKDKEYILKKNIQNKKGILVIKDNLQNIINIYFKEKYILIQEPIYNKGIQFVLRVYILGILREKEENQIEIYYNKHHKLLYAKNNDLITNSKLIPKNPDYTNYLNKINSIFETIKYIFRKEIKNTIPKKTKYQLFGIDIKFDEKLNPYLLEINKHPNLSNFHSKKEKKEKYNMNRDMYKLVIKYEKNSFIKV